MRQAALLSAPQQEQAGDRNSPGAELPRLVIVGGGMAAHGLCQKLVELGVHSRMHVTVIGEEPQPAYDRVNVSRLLSGMSSDELLLSSPDWYSDAGISLKTNHKVTHIDRADRCVEDANGTHFPYDRLVLATGSYPWVPPIKGVFKDAPVDRRKPSELSPGVFVYRTIADLEKIREFSQVTNCKRAAVIGGGLLGLEAAKVLRDLGLSPNVIEAAPGLMPRQLSGEASSMLREKVESIGVEVHTIRRTNRVESHSSGIRIHFDNADPLEVGILVIAAGVRPRDELASIAGLTLGERGGVVVDENLQTNDPFINAIGECVVFRKHNYGLVAPCYRMADVLAERLNGLSTKFEGADESAELKLLGVPVVALGEPLDEFTAGVVLKYKDQSCFRQILLEKGRVRGVAAVGDWGEIPLLRYAVEKQRVIWPHQRRRFERTGNLLLGAENLPVSQWPGDAVVCACRAVTCNQIKNCGADTLEGVRAKTGASAACGGCESLVQQLSGEAGQPVPFRLRDQLLLAASTVAIVTVSLWLLAKPFAFATSVQSSAYQVDWWWRSTVGKQVTGYSLVGTSAVGLGLYVLKKRTNLLRFFSYAAYRNVHTISSMLALFLLIAHTGFRSGVNANFWLNMTFLSLAVVGGFTGLLSAMENKLTGANAMLARRWRPRLALLHLILFGPLPVLLAIHIISVYWY